VVKIPEGTFFSFKRSCVYIKMTWKWTVDVIKENVWMDLDWHWREFSGSPH
jgi:hypothetical protein